jgi:hypothetical protein
MLFGETRRFVHLLALLGEFLQWLVTTSRSFSVESALNIARQIHTTLSLISGIVTNLGSGSRSENRSLLWPIKWILRHDIRIMIDVDRVIGEFVQTLSISVQSWSTAPILILVLVSFSFETSFELVSALGVV